MGLSKRATSERVSLRNHTRTFGELMTMKFKRLYAILILTLLVSGSCPARSEEHTSELQSRLHLVCRLLLEKKNTCDGRAWLPRQLSSRLRALVVVPHRRDFLARVVERLVGHGERPRRPAACRAACGHARSH